MLFLDFYVVLVCVQILMITCFYFSHFRNCDPQSHHVGTVYSRFAASSLQDINDAFGQFACEKSRKRYDDDDDAVTHDCQVLAEVQCDTLRTVCDLWIVANMGTS